MRKKILDAALLFAFALCLIVTSNIQEEAAYVAELENEAVPLQDQEAEPEEMQFSAGVAAAISANSFTTESDEKTGVEKKDVVLVTTSNDSESNLEEETDGSVETNTEVSESGQVEEVSGTSQAPAYNNRWNISLTDEEIDLLAKIVWLEANGEPVEGQEAVVELHGFVSDADDLLFEKGLGQGRFRSEVQVGVEDQAFMEEVVFRSQGFLHFHDHVAVPAFLGGSNHLSAGGDILFVGDHAAEASALLHEDGVTGFFKSMNASGSDADTEFLNFDFGGDTYTHLSASESSMLKYVLKFRVGLYSMPSL